MSAFSGPLLVEGEVASLLKRVQLSGGDALSFSEQRLQELLYRFPQTLPVAEIDARLGELIPVCMELETGAGPADILYVTRNGQLVLVETKLWRNPESRRAVVAQILDYAKQLSGWDYDTLDRGASRASKKQPGHILRAVKDWHAEFSDAEHAAFVDAVSKSLKTGDFLLLIVGDGIRYGAESLVNFLEQYGHLRFSLSLIEVAAFSTPRGQLLLQPRVLAKTETLQKTVLVGPSGPLSFQQAAHADDEAPPNTSQREWFIAFWREFFTKLHVDDVSIVPKETKSANVYFPMPPGGASAWISAFIAQSTNKGGAYLTFAKTYEDASSVYEELLASKSQIESEFGSALTWSSSQEKFYVSVPNISLGDLNTTVDRERVTSYLAQSTAKLIAVLQPRLASITRR